MRRTVNVPGKLGLKVSSRTVDSVADVAGFLEEFTGGALRFRRLPVRCARAISAVASACVRPTPPRPRIHRGWGAPAQSIPDIEPKNPAKPTDDDTHDEL